MITISLENVKINAPIGYYPEERILRNDFYIDIHIKIDEKDQEITDLPETIDYALVYDLIKEEMEKEHRLIEQVAQNCVSTIKKKWPRIKGIDMNIRKLHPPISGEIGASKVSLSKEY